MKKILYLILLTIIFLIGTIEVNASSGALKNASITVCNGITYGQHSSDNHWHVAEESNGKYYATGEPIYSNPCVSSDNSSNNYINNNSGSSEPSYNDSLPNENYSISEEKIKSNDNTIKNIIIDGKEIDVNDTMDYYTSKEKISIEVTPNDKNAKYEIKNNSNLEIGENKIEIEVTAEDGTIKTYSINVKRSKVLSSDTGIKITINKEIVNFDKNKATVYVSSTEKKLKIDYTLSNKNANIEMNKIEKLKTGNNELTIKVIAEDGTKKEYTITIHKYTKFEETIITILKSIIIFGVSYAIYCFIFGIGIYYAIKKISFKFKKQRSLN